MRISPLRQRMIDDMTARHFGEKSQKDYIRCVLNFALFICRSPDTATLEDLQRFRLHLTGSSLSVASVNTAIAVRCGFSSASPSTSQGFSRRCSGCKHPRSCP
jgi:integrase/recombinase XerD